MEAASVAMTGAVLFVVGGFYDDDDDEERRTKDEGRSDYDYDHDDDHDDDDDLGGYKKKGLPGSSQMAGRPGTW